jgi:hypothetical protein
VWRGRTERGGGVEKVLQLSVVVNSLSKAKSRRGCEEVNESPRRMRACGGMKHRAAMFHGTSWLIDA